MQTNHFHSISGVSEYHFEHIPPPELLVLIRKLQNNYPFFSEMDDNEIGHFLNFCEREDFRSGEVFFREGEEGDDFFLIVSGAIGIRVGGNKAARMKEGQVFGEMANLEDGRHTTSAVASVPSLLFSVSRTVLHSKMSAFTNKVIVSIARQLSRKLRETNETIKRLQSQLDQARKP